ncbi:MAG: methyltransferase domain-containing protein [bacterium]
MNNLDGNIRERAIPGVHQAVFNKITKCFPEPKDICILDLGAGEGAMSKRLASAGYYVEATEISEGRFQVNPVPCHCLDLNKDFAQLFNQKFNAIVAIEIIEHLENPRHFLKNCRQLLDESGILFLTSPNVESWNSRLIFLKHGRFQFFGDVDYQNNGHITPLFSWQIEQILNETDFKLLHRAGLNERFVWHLAYSYSGYPPMTFLIKLVLWCSLGLHFRKNTQGATNLFIAGAR